MKTLAEAGAEMAPVARKASIGLVTARGILRAYRAAASRVSREVREPAEGTPA